jgi:hypothetical protein
MASQSDSADNRKQRLTKIIRPKPKKTINEIKNEDPNTLNTTSHNTISQDTDEMYCDPELFVKRQIRRVVTIPFYKLTKTVVLAQLLRTELAKMVEGRCSIEGYICPNSISISSYSCGTLAAANILFDIVADCLICFPDENMVIKCVAKTITQAGIRAGARYLHSGHVSPIEVFLSRDMHSSSRELFSRVEENDILTVRIIGRRFVLNDTHVTIIALLLDAQDP